MLTSMLPMASRLCPPWERPFGLGAPSSATDWMTREEIVSTACEAGRQLDDLTLGTSVPP
jgi:hypothetical protein